MVVSAEGDSNRFLFVLADKDNPEQDKRALVFSLEIIDQKIAAVIRINGKVVWMSQKIQTKTP